MPITPAQRTTALTLLLSNYGNDTVIGTYIPGLTTALMVQDLVASIGTTFDAALTTALNEWIAQAQASITATEAGIADIQAQIQANTVTP